MNDRPEESEDDDIPETDFSGGVRGKYYQHEGDGDAKDAVNAVSQENADTRTGEAL